MSRVLVAAVRSATSDYFPGPLLSAEAETTLLYEECGNACVASDEITMVAKELEKTPEDQPVMADGKRRLIEAALRLSARGTALSSLGLRELAREAELNHNTFYRHFTHVDELGQAAAEAVAAQIMAGMKQVRKSAMQHPDVNRAAAEYFFDYVLLHPEPFVVGLREAHSTATPMRRVMKQVLDHIAEESVEQIVGMKLAPGLSDAALRQATSAITYYMFYRALDCIEEPARQSAIVDEVADFIRMQFLGALALQELR